MMFPVELWMIICNTTSTATKKQLSLTCSFFACLLKKDIQRSLVVSEHDVVTAMAIINCKVLKIKYNDSFLFNEVFVLHARVLSASRFEQVTLVSKDISLVLVPPKTCFTLVCHGDVTVFFQIYEMLFPYLDLSISIENIQHDDRSVIWSCNVRTDVINLSVEKCTVMPVSIIRGLKGLCETLSCDFDSSTCLLGNGPLVVQDRSREFIHPIDVFFENGSVNVAVSPGGHISKEFLVGIASASQTNLSIELHGTQDMYDVNEEELQGIFSGRTVTYFSTQ